MKKILFLLFFPMTTTICFSQVNNYAKHSASIDYLKKSKSQKTIVWVMVGSGVAMIGGGFAINLSSGWGAGNTNKGLWLCYVGGATALGSIPFFISASKNKHRAVSVFINAQPLPDIARSGNHIPAIPSLSLKIGL